VIGAGIGPGHIALELPPFGRPLLRQAQRGQVMAVIAGFGWP
jgi:starvation-inducible outer membrane lipoprotein